MKKTAAFLASSLAALSAGSVNAVDFSGSGNIGLDTDYVFRGFSQTDEAPAVSGGYDLEIGLGENLPGLYLGVWASNIDFGDGSIEIDYYGGTTFELGGVGIDVGYLLYDYPEAGSQDYNEVYATFSMSEIPFIGDLSVGVAHSPDYFAGTDTYNYFTLDTSTPLPIQVAEGVNFALNLHYGYNDFDSAADFSNFLGVATNEDRYADISVGLAAGFSDWGVSLTFHTLAGISRSEKGDLGNDRLVFRIERSL